MPFFIATRFKGDFDFLVDRFDEFLAVHHQFVNTTRPL